MGGNLVRAEPPRVFAVFLAQNGGVNTWKHDRMM